MRVCVCVCARTSGIKAKAGEQGSTKADHLRLVVVVVGLIFDLNKSTTRRLESSWTT